MIVIEWRWEDRDRQEDRPDVRKKLGYAGASNAGLTISTVNSAVLAFYPRVGSREVLGSDR